MAYHNPDGVIEKEGPKKIKVRFSSVEELIEFGKKIGVDLSKTVKVVKYDPDSSLEDFFD